MKERIRIAINDAVERILRLETGIPAVVQTPHDRIPPNAVINAMNPPACPLGQPILLTLNFFVGPGGTLG